MAALQLSLLIIAVNALLTRASTTAEDVTTVTCAPNEVVSIQCALEANASSGNTYTSDEPQWQINGEDIMDTISDSDVVVKNKSLLVLTCSVELDSVTVHCKLPHIPDQWTRIVVQEGKNSSSIIEFLRRWETILIISCAGGFIIGVIGIISTIYCCLKWRKGRRKWRQHKLADKNAFKQRQKARTEQENKEREKIVKAVSSYLSATKSYTILEKLKDLGCRLQKYWFLIKSTSNDETLLLTILPVSRNCALKLNCKTVGILDMLFAKYIKEQPPYIQLIHKIDYIPSPEPGSGYVIIIQDWHPKGSLRDTLQGLDPKQDWVDLSDRGNPLPVDKVVRYGRQILEALLYLNKEGFPSLAHVHSGNIYINASDDTVRVGGYENTLLGYKTRLYRTFHNEESGMTINWDLIDVFLFGHVIYEMATGKSLECAIPTDNQLSGLEDELAELLRHIFSFNWERKSFFFPVTAHSVLEKIKKHDFFKDQSVTQSKISRNSKHITALLQRVEKGIAVQQDNDDEFVARIQQDTPLHDIDAEKTVRNYLAKSQCYTSPTKLDQTGDHTQVGKFMFQIKSSDRKDLLLTMLPVAKKCALQLNSNTTINTLNQYFKSLIEEKPPFIHIVHKIDYIPPTSVNDARGHVIIIQEWYPKGSLRNQIPNLMVRSNPILTKEASETTPLCTATIDQAKLVDYGSQILEALLFFTEEEFPPLAHVHCGNIYIDDDDTVRVGGYENTLLGHRTRLYRTFHKPGVNWDLIDIFMFGHVMYEMATGQSLQCAIPTDEDYSSVGDEEVTEILKYIFYFNKPRYFWQHSISAQKALKEIRKHKFFKNCDGQVKRSKQFETDEEFKSLLKQVEKGEPVDMTANTISQELATLTD